MVACPLSAQGPAGGFLPLLRPSRFQGSLWLRYPGPLGPLKLGRWRCRAQLGEAAGGPGLW
eukprot:7353958-Pyramimonas_sp.AAC.1